jgi:hypothetical protein
MEGYESMTGKFLLFPCNGWMGSGGPNHTFKVGRSGIYMTWNQAVAVYGAPNIVNTGSHTICPDCNSHVRRMLAGEAEAVPEPA